MPLTMTHTYVANDIYLKLDKRIRNNFTKEDKNDLLVFSKGFDVFFFYFDIKHIKYSKEVMEGGVYFHRHQVNEFLINLTEKVKKSKDKKEFLYLAGLITHYVADSKMHPYINYKASKLIKPHIDLKDCHFMLESYFDNYLINKREKIAYPKFKVYEEACFDTPKNSKIVELLNTSFEEVFGYSNMGNNYYIALLNMKKFFHFFRHDPIGFKRVFYLSVNFLAKRVFRDVSYLSYNFKLEKDEDFLNLNHEEWYNLRDKKAKSSKSLLELYDEAVILGVKIIEQVYDYIFLDKKVNLENLYGNKSYSNGLVIK